MSTTEKQYERADLTSKKLEKELRTFFDKAKNDPAVEADAKRTDVDLDKLLAGGPDQISVTPGDASLTGFEELLVIALLTPPVQTAWTDVILPWLKRRTNRPVGQEAKPKARADKGTPKKGKTKKHPKK